MAGMEGTRRRVGRIATGAAFALALVAAVLVLVPALPIAAVSLAGLWRRLGSMAEAPA